MPFAAVLFDPLTWIKKSLVAIIPMYSRVAGGVSAPRDWNATATVASALMKLPEAARQIPKLRAV